MSKTKTPNPIFLLLFGLIGLLLMGLGVFFYLQSSELVSQGISAEGTVTKIFHIGSHDPSYYAKIEFKTDDGKTISFDYTIRNSYSLSVGEKVPVLYMRDNPSLATKDSFNGIWMKPIGSLLIGFLFSAAGFWSFYYLQNQQKLKADLAINGRKITAPVYEVYALAGSTNKSAIWAQYEENGKKYLYTSEEINLPVENLKDLKTVEITVDPNNLKRYVFDTEKIAREHSKNSQLSL